MTVFLLLLIGLLHLQSFQEVSARTSSLVDPGSVNKTISSVDSLLQQSDELEEKPVSIARLVRQVPLETTADALPLRLFCNLAGPCRECPAKLKHKDVSPSEAHVCHKWAHVQDLECIMDDASAQHSADVIIDDLSSLSNRQKASGIAYHTACSIDKSPMSVFWFEFTAVAILCIALPVVIWQKHLSHKPQTSNMF